MRERVVVVGGGIAGLTAAADLVDTRAVTVLEARERWGGRIVTAAGLGGVPIEMGAEFVHGRAPELWERIREAGLRTHEVQDRHWRAQGGRLVELTDFWQRLEEVTEEIEPEERDESFARFLASIRKSREAVELAKEFVENFHAAPVERASTQAIRLNEESSEEIDGQRQFRIHEGFGKLVEQAVERCRKTGVDLRGGSEVVCVNWGGKQLELRLRSGEVIEAERAIITLPIGVLQSGRVDFRPLPEKKLEAIRALGIGKVSKVVLSFRERFWPEPNFGFIHAAGESFSTWWADERGDILTAWAGGRRGAAIARESEEAVVDLALKEAAELFNISEGKARDLLGVARWNNWVEDPFSLGAYSFIPVNALWASEELARPEDGRLFFAGEATDLNHQFGTVHGAIASGARAARDVRAAR